MNGGTFLCLKGLSILVDESPGIPAPSIFAKPGEESGSSPFPPVPEYVTLAIIIIINIHY